MSNDELPPGFGINSPEQMENLGAVATAVLQHLAGLVNGVAIVVAMPDGTVTAALAGNLCPAFEGLLETAPEVLRHTIERFLAGKGETKVRVKS